jgi:hypothetical protein
MDDIQTSTNGSGQQNLTDQQKQDDIQALQDLKKNLEDEQNEIDQILADAADEVQMQTADDLKTFEDAAQEIDQLQKQADEEEQAGDLEQARQNVARS